jgi:hypothetical protein
MDEHAMPRAIRIMLIGSCMAPPDDNQLNAQLVESSATFARSALQAQHDDHRVFLLHAGTALEHLAKAVLARRHPSLIVASNDFESLLHACGESTAARRLRSKMRTTNAAEAIGRASRFVPTVKALVPDIELLILVRNGVAHLGAASSDDAEDVLVPYLKASEELRAALDMDRATYWGEFVDLVDSALKENVEKARLRVETALAIAPQEFEKHFGELDTPTKQGMLRVIEAGYAPEKYDEQLLDCPACGTPALAFGSVKVEMGRGLGSPRARPHRRPRLLHVHPEPPPLQPLRARARRARRTGRRRDRGAVAA